jgi:hypothetical protein
MPDSIVLPPLDTICNRCTKTSFLNNDFQILLKSQKYLICWNPLREAEYTLKEVDSISRMGLQGSYKINTAIRNIKKLTAANGVQLSDQFYQYFTSTANEMGRYKQILIKGGLYTSKTIVAHQKVWNLAKLELIMACLDNCSDYAK